MGLKARVSDLEKAEKDNRMMWVPYCKVNGKLITWPVNVQEVVRALIDYLDVQWDMPQPGKLIKRETTVTK